jgi:hypothetical protein
MSESENINQIPQGGKNAELPKMPTGIGSDHKIGHVKGSVPKMENPPPPPTKKI